MPDKEAIISFKVPVELRDRLKVIAKANETDTSKMLRKYVRDVVEAAEVLEEGQSVPLSFKNLYKT